MGPFEIAWSLLKSDMFVDPVPREIIEQGLPRFRGIYQPSTVEYPEPYIGTNVAAINWDDFDQGVKDFSDTVAHEWTHHNTKSEIDDWADRHGKDIADRKWADEFLAYNQNAISPQERTDKLARHPATKNHPLTQKEKEKHGMVGVSYPDIQDLPHSYYDKFKHLQ